MRSVRHWTPRYVCNRIALAYYEKRHPDAPWLTAAAIALLDSILKPSDVGFEWGSGRSTRWFARRVARLMSIESERAWFDRVSQMLSAEQITNVELKWHICDGADREKLDAYAHAIDAFDSLSLDFVLVDGSLRDACAAHAVGKVKPGGFLIIDNCNRYLPSRSYSPASRSQRDGPASYVWQKFCESVADWRRVWTSNGVTDTAIWFRV